ncbi:MAG: TIGR00730 family Rossman fold protein [Paludibacteraceae bacterium]|nr:TIGR00730 family Rossman fold protein [Paludibacteraceae bacterium]
MKIAVYCSSSNLIAEHYKQMAFELGKWIANERHTLVYGGAVGGLMTAVAEGAYTNKGNIIGVIPQSVINKGRKTNLPIELHTTYDLNERKKLMKQLADIFIVLPGSFGTLDEMFDVVSAGTLNEHKKPLIILNWQHYYDHLIELFAWMKQEKCLPKAEIYKPEVATTLEDCINIINKYIIE